MLPQNHIFLGIGISVLIYIFFPTIGILNLIVFFAASILIDIDHYLYYIYKKGDWNLISAIKWFLVLEKESKKMGNGENRGNPIIFYAFHGFEILILFGILGVLVSNLFYFACMGIFLHLILDYIKLFSNKNPVEKLSIIWDYFSYKNKILFEGR